MADQDPIERLNDVVESIVSSREAADLACVAAALRDLPDPSFRLSLKEELMQVVDQQRTYLPPGFPTVTPYLIVKGAAELIAFLKEAFGAEEKMRFPLPDGSLMHAQVQIGDSPVELADGNPQYPTRATALHIYVPDADDTYARAIAAGAVSVFEPADREYGDREAGIRDPSGNQWYIATHKLRPGAHTPEGLRSVTPYFHADGASAFIDFLKRAFGAEEIAAHPNPDGSIAHAKLRIGDSMVELSDARGQWRPMPGAIHLYVPNADSVFAHAIEAGATPVYELKDQPYGERSGGVRDPFGNEWYIATYTGRGEELQP